MSVTIKLKNKCSNCGKCCKEEVCEIGEILTMMFNKKDDAPCWVLIEIDKKFYCGAAIFETLFFDKNLIRESLGIGKGCDSDFVIEKVKMN